MFIGWLFFSSCLYSFFTLHSIIHPRATTEFIYRYNDPNIAHIFLSFKLDTSSRKQEVEKVLEEIKNQGMTGYDISDDEVAKSHARYMIRGCTAIPNERVFRFGGYSSHIWYFHFALCLPESRSRISWTARRTAQVPSGYLSWIRLEYITVPLPQSRRRFAQRLLCRLCFLMSLSQTLAGC